MNNENTLPGEYIDQIIDMEYNRIARLYPKGLRGYLKLHPYVSKVEVMEKERDVKTLNRMLDVYYEIMKACPSGLMAFIQMCRDKGIKPTFKVIFKSVKSIQMLEDIAKEMKKEKELKKCVNNWETFR